jgi:tetratricopeptide (TPR) repeat protein
VSDPKVYSGAPVIDPNGSRLAGLCVHVAGELRCVWWSTLLRFVAQRISDIESPRPEVQADVVASAMNRSQELYNSGDRVGALKVVQQALQLVQDERLHVRAAVILNQFDRPEEAEIHAETAIELRSDYAAAHRELGVALERLGSEEQAERSLRSAITFDPKDADAWAALGALYRDQNRLQEAFDAYDRASQLSSEPGIFIATVRLKVLIGQRVDDVDQKGLLEAQRRRRADVDASPPIDAPWSFFDLADIMYFLGRPDDQREYLALGVTFASPLQIKAQLDWLKNLESVTGDRSITESIHFLESFGSPL